jgi:hypothetical protein
MWLWNSSSLCRLIVLVMLVDTTCTAVDVMRAQHSTCDAAPYASPWCHPHTYTDQLWDRLTVDPEEADWLARLEEQAAELEGFQDSRHAQVGARSRRNVGCTKRDGRAGRQTGWESPKALVTGVACMLIYCVLLTPHTSTQGTFLRGTLSRSLAEGAASLWHGRSGSKAKKEEAAAAGGGSLGAMGGAMLGG